MKPLFDHEKPTVYQSSITFITWSTALLSQVKTKAAVKDQLDRASTSIPLNIAEGNGKFAITGNRLTVAAVSDRRIN